MAQWGVLIYFDRICEQNDQSEDSSIRKPGGGRAFSCDNGPRLKPEITPLVDTKEVECHKRKRKMRLDESPTLQLWDSEHDVTSCSCFVGQESGKIPKSSGSCTRDFQLCAA